VGGLAVVVLYLTAVAYSWPLAPVRILYDGEAPPLPYRWVHPPANLPEGNQTPEPGAGSIALGPAGSQATSLVTGDAQAGMIFRSGAIAPRAGATSVQVTLTPLDPATVSRPPQDLQFDGNAYRADAIYSTGEPIALRMPVTAVLRYPKHATMLLRFAGAGWTPLEAHNVAGSLQIFAATDHLGVFVAAAPATAGRAPWKVYVAVGAAALGGLAAITGLLVRTRRRRLRSTKG
jgi:hypothetical protein